MQTVDVQNVDMSDLLNRVHEGETVVLERNGQAVARLVPERRPTSMRPRMAGFGFLKGKMTVPDDIKGPFAAEIEEMFYGDSSLEPSENSAHADSNV